MKLSNKVYDGLKYVAIIGMPAAATLYAAVAKIWNLPYVEEIPATITAVQTCLGALLMISTAEYNKTTEVK